MGVLVYLNDLDRSIFQTINGFCGHSVVLDHIADRLEDFRLKGLALALTFGALWFQNIESLARRRQTLILLLVSIVFSLVIARLLADLLPFRVRPMFALGIEYRAPLFQVQPYFENWSSFPSDIAAVVFSAATGFWLVSRWWGVLWTIFGIVTLLARSYFGLHYPGDLVIGGLIGAGVTLATNNEFMREHVATPILVFERWRPAIFYGLLLPILLEFSSLFSFTREIFHAIRQIPIRQILYGVFG